MPTWPSACYPAHVLVRQSPLTQGILVTAACVLSKIVAKDDTAFVVLGAPGLFVASIATAILESPHMTKAVDWFQHWRVDRVSKDATSKTTAWRASSRSDLE